MNRKVMLIPILAISILVFAILMTPRDKGPEETKANFRLGSVYNDKYGYGQYIHLDITASIPITIEFPERPNVSSNCIMRQSEFDLSRIQSLWETKPSKKFSLLAAAEISSYEPCVYSTWFKTSLGETIAISVTQPLSIYRIELPVRK